MYPLLACFPVCTLFFALAIVMVIVLLCFPTTEASEMDAVTQAAEPATRFPAWWAKALIPIVIAAVFGLLAWLTAGN